MLLIKVLLLYFYSSNIGFCQTTQLLPQEFQFLSINSKALEKTIDLTIDSLTNQNTQNIPLDKTGVILHINTSPKIKDKDTKIRIFSSKGEEVQLFPFKDSSLFALIDPEKTYSISEEIVINCDELKNIFNTISSNIICPDLEIFKLLDNIIVSSDTSLKVRLITPSEFYLLPIEVLNTETNQPKDISNIIQITNESSSGTINNLSTNLTLKDVLNKSTICINGQIQNQPLEPPLECNVINPNIKSQILYKENLLNINSTENSNLAFSLPLEIFNTSKQVATININESLKSPEEPTIVGTNKNSVIPEPIFNNHNFILKINLGKVKKGKDRIKKNVFSIKSPLNLTTLLNKTTFSLPRTSLETFINPFSTNEAKFPLTSISISGKDKSNTISFNIQTENNIFLKTLVEPTPEATPIQQTAALQTISTNENIKIISYLPPDSYEININRNYSFAEQDTAPSVNENGDTTNIVNNKSKANIDFNTNIKDIDITKETTEDISLDFEKASSILKKEKSFNQPILFSGFLTPPDFRPILEEGYRATISLERIFDLNADDFNTIKLNYSDIKTKDETPLTNFFKFSFVPQGLYKAIIKFDANREELFIMAGLIKKDE